MRINAFQLHDNNITKLKKSQYLCKILPNNETIKQ